MVKFIKGQTTGTVMLTMISGHNLRAADGGYYSDPYCIVEFHSTDGTARRYSSAVIKRTLAPEWGESFTVPVDEHTNTVRAVATGLIPSSIGASPPSRLDVPKVERAPGGA